MVRYAALDVSLETTAICVVDEDGHMVAEGKVRTCPDAIRDFLASRAPGLRRVGLETGPLAVWLWNELRDESIQNRGGLVLARVRRGPADGARTGQRRCGG